MADIIEQATKELVKLYIDSSKRLLDGIDETTAFDRVRRQNLLKQIDTELNDLMAKSDKWANTELKRLYQAGMEDAIEGSRLLIENGAMGKNALNVTTGFNVFNKAQVQALIDEANNSFAQAMNVVGRNARSITAQATQRTIRAKIAEGVVTGNTRIEIANAIKAEFKNRGLTALTDKAGRNWSLDRYADMLARTKLSEARNTGLANKMLENGNDLVQVSINGSSHKECADWEGKVLSLTGKTDGYPTVDEASSGGLFHPNCKHVINVINVDLAKETYGWNSVTQEYEQGIIDNPSNNLSLMKDQRGAVPISVSGGARPYNELQLKIEQAHNAGDTVLRDQLITKLPPDLQKGMGFNITAPTGRRAVVNPKTGKIEIIGGN
jgi:hypothetical protein